MMDRRGIVSVTKGPADLIAPTNVPAGQVWRYGVGIPFQVARGKAAICANVRGLGVPVIDFEVGTDVIVFDSLEDLSAAAKEAVAITRIEEVDEVPGFGRVASGKRLCLIKHLLIGGFVPQGAKREDGSDHPHAGTGFALGLALACPADLSERLPEHRGYPRRLELLQLAYDGTEFRVTKRENLGCEELLPPWRILNRGLSAAIPDGDDLLVGLVEGEPESASSGLSRWRRGKAGWRPVSYVPVTAKDTSMEPSVHRDADGALLMGVRCAAHDKGDGVSFGIRLWRSADNGQTWNQIVQANKVRASTPVVLNQAADGTPYVTANPWRDAAFNAQGQKMGIWSHRQQLYLWPVNEKRDDLEAPIVLRDTDQEFSPPSATGVWCVDHPIGTTVQLADGRWHHLLCYRIKEHKGGVKETEQPTERTGLYVEEVISRGEPRGMWRF